MAESGVTGVPEGCPGMCTEQAGKASPCQGCPNQASCASGQTQGPDPAVEQIKERLDGVRYKVLVLSGKGGVGKSTLTAQLALGIASDESKQVAVLDIDICGPSMPRILGLDGEQVYYVECSQPLKCDGPSVQIAVNALFFLTREVHQSGSGWSPVYSEDGIALMSTAFLLSSAADAVIWRGPKKNGLIKQFLRDVDWGETDYLIVDTPPGTSDEHLSTVQLLSAAKIDGAVVVTTPQEAALQDVRKEVDFCRKLKLPVIGVVENMSVFVCPKCKNESQIFPPTSGGAEKMCHDMGLDLLGKVPLDPRIARCCDEGRPFLTEVPDSPACTAYRAIVQRVQRFCEAKLEESKAMD